MSSARVVAFCASSADSGGCRRGGVGGGGSASLAGVPEAADAGAPTDAADAAEAADAPDAALADSARFACDAADVGAAADASDAACADEAGCGREAAEAGDATDEDCTADDGASGAAKAGRCATTEIDTAAASHTDAATARLRQRGCAKRRVKWARIICSKPSADPAAAWCRCERRIFRASRRHARHIACARRRRLFTAEPFADATRALRWRLMSRQAPYFTRPCANRPRPEARFYGELRFVTLCFNSLPRAYSWRGTLACSMLSARGRVLARWIRFERVSRLIRTTKHFGEGQARKRKPRTASHACRNEPCDMCAHPPITWRWFRARCPSCAAPSARSRPSRSPSRPR